MKRYSLLALVTTTILLVGGCKKDDPSTIDLGHAYFPADIGRWVEYHVDSLYVDGTVSTTWSYDIREVITENFTDLEGRPAQRFIRYARDTANAWYPKDIWWQTRDNVRAERSEENMRRVKLVFPPRTTSAWNTNATNSSDELELTYDEVDVPWSNNGLAFDSTVLVVTTYPNNAVSTKIYQERYAKHAGLVYRQVDSSETQAGSFHRYKVTYAATAYGN